MFLNITTLLSCQESPRSVVKNMQGAIVENDKNTFMSTFLIGNEENKKRIDALFEFQRATYELNQLLEGKYKHAELKGQEFDLLFDKFYWAKDWFNTGTFIRRDRSIFFQPKEDDERFEIIDYEDKQLIWANRGLVPWTDNLQIRLTIEALQPSRDTNESDNLLVEEIRTEEERLSDAAKAIRGLSIEIEENNLSIEDIQNKLIGIMIGLMGGRI